MTAARWFVTGVCGLLGLALATGCQNPDRIQIEKQADEITRLQNENNDLRNQLAQAIAERDQLRNRVAALQRENDQLRAQLAAQPPVERGPKGWEVAGPYAWTTLSTDFLFDSGKATLRPAAKAKLQQVVNEIQSNFPNKAIWVLGHTDTDPINKTKHLWKDNLDLSCNRGMTVYRELMNLGIRPERMMAGGQGEWFPRASNTTAAGKQQNRRVEIIAVDPRPATGAAGTGAPAGPSAGEALVPVPK